MDTGDTGDTGGRFRCIKRRNIMVEIRKPNTFPKMLMTRVEALPGIRYVPSLYALPFEHKGKHYVFHNMTKQCIAGVLPDSALAGEGFDDLIEARFLVPEDLDESAYCAHIAALLRAGIRDKKGTNMFTILPTLGCNARCTYCYEQGLSRPVMTPETADQVIRYILRTHTRPQVLLHWFGGEPLLGEKIIDRICDGLREAGLAYESHMISNGSLITPAILRKMTGPWNLTEIQISMDGEESDYVRRKRYSVDRDYYHQVMESVGRMSEAGIRVTISCNVDEENWSGIPQFLEDFFRTAADKKNVSIEFSPLFDLRHSDDDVAMAKKILSARRLVEAAGLPYQPNMKNALVFRPWRCKAAAGAPVIWPDGGLYTCATIAPDGRYGDIWNGVTDEAARAKFTRMDRIREKCRACPYLPNCTTYEHCPIEDKHCQEVRGLLLQELLDMLAETWERESA